MHNEISDNSSDGPQYYHYWMLSVSIGMMIGYYMCLVDNDDQNQSMYYWTRYPDLVRRYQSVKDYKYRSYHHNSLYHNICHYGNLIQFKLNTQTGYQTYKMEIKQLLFYNHNQQKEQKQKQRQDMIHQNEKDVLQFEQYL